MKMQQAHSFSISQRLVVSALLLGCAAGAALTTEQPWAACAGGCHCSPDGLAADCSGIDAGAVRAELPPGLQALSLSVHRVRSVDNETFAHLPQLRQLDLSDGRISDVMVDGFPSLPQLLLLNLSNNELTYLPADAFAGNPRLERLDLSSNPLVLPSVGPFLRSTTMLQLSLADCGLSRVTPDSFSQLPKLASLDLTSNALRGLTEDDLNQLPELSRLHVDSDALSDGALQYLLSKDVVVETVNVSDDTGYLGVPQGLQAEDEQTFPREMFLGFLDMEYQEEEAVNESDDAQQAPEDINIGVGVIPSDELPSEEDGTLTGILTVRRYWKIQWHGPQLWRNVMYASLLLAAICVPAALTCLATVTVLRRREARRAAQQPQETLARAYRNVTSLPQLQQLQRGPTKGSSKGYERLLEEEDGSASLPPRADEPCTCLSCTEPMPTQPCIRFYQPAAPVHGAVPGHYYRL